MQGSHATQASSPALCERCHIPIEPELIQVSPATRVCLECLTPQEARALERDLELARSIQAALLPKNDLDLDGYRVCHEYRPLGPVSGDYCDVLLPTVENGPWHFVLGDVSGKGVSASILMSHLHATFRSLIPQGLPLADVVSRANRLLTESTLPSSYATMLAGRLDPSGLLELCNAGHCPAVLVRDGRTLRVGGPGMPLGFFADATFERHVLRMEPGDLLFLYTDGLTESLGATGEPYGPERIDRLLQGVNGQAPQAVLRGCLQDLDLFCGGVPREDDLTVMAIRRID